MRDELEIGLLNLNVPVDKNGSLKLMLEQQGHIVRSLDSFRSDKIKDVVFFEANDEGLAAFRECSCKAAWIAIEPTFIESKFKSLLDCGVQDVLFADQLNANSLSRSLIRVRRQLITVRSIANYDSQIGCHNAEGFTLKISQAIEKTAETGRPFSVCSIDIKRFQKINESHGYLMANQTLSQVAHRLINLEAGRFCIGRLGGDEFLLLVEDLSDKKELQDILESVRQVFLQRFEILGVQIEVAAVMGAILYPECYGTAEDLVAQAHEAMKTAKRHQQQIFVYDRTSTPWIQMDMAAEIRRALRHDEFELHYQPRVDLDTRRVVGMEALIRWNHPRFGNIPPSEFIFMAEQNGMILPLGNWVLERAERDILTIERGGLVGLGIAINLSFKQLQDAAFCKNLPKRIKKWKAYRSQLEIELTETSVMKNIALVKKTLNTIHKLGVKISLDDFGTGYSALVHVQEFPISTVKIDKSFVKTMDNGINGQSIVESIINFAHRLNLDVVGEGIEQSSQLHALRSMGCDQGQGFYFSKALPLNDFIQYAGKANGSGSLNAYTID